MIRSHLKPDTGTICPMNLIYIQSRNKQQQRRHRIKKYTYTCYRPKEKSPRAADDE